MVYFQSLLYGLRLIILADLQLLATVITNAFRLWRDVYYMVCCATARTYTTSTHSVDDRLILECDLDRIVNLLAILCQCSSQCLCLRNGSRESV